MGINTLFKNIADAIRSKGSSSDTLTPAQMPQAILDLPSGGGSNALMEFLTDSSQHSAYGYTQTADPNVAGYKNFIAVSTNIQNFIDNLATSTYIKEGSATITITDAILAYSILDYLTLLPVAGREYKGNINSTIISDYNLSLLCDASQGTGYGRPFTLSDSISNYDAIILNGIYYSDPTSGYNTTMCYSEIELNKDYWTGMKDRNQSYDCYVKFTDNTTAYLHGSSRSQCIIYGIN